MSATAELDRLLKKAGVIAYRKIGKVRLAHDPRLPAQTLACAVDAVRAFGLAHPDHWPTYRPEDGPKWLKLGVTAVREVHDDPCPPDIDPLTCDARWIVGRCARYSFRMTSPGPGKVVGVGIDGWDMAEVRKFVPDWFRVASGKRIAELAAIVRAAA